MLVETHHLQNECGENIDALAVPDGFVVSCVGQQNSLQYCVFLIRREAGRSSSVEVLRDTGEGAMDGNGQALPEHVEI